MTADLLPEGEIHFSAKYLAKDGKWVVMTETRRDCFVFEDRSLGKAMAQATLRVQGF